MRVRTILILAAVGLVLGLSAGIWTAQIQGFSLGDKVIEFIRPADGSQREVTVSLSTTEVEQGDYVVVFVHPTQPQERVTVTSEMLQESPHPYSYVGGHVVLLPIHYRATPGTYPVSIEIERTDKSRFQTVEQIEVRKRDFSVQHLTVSPSQSEQRSEDRWAVDRQLVAAARASSAAQPLWDAEFLMPTDGRITTEYGLIRYINGVDSGRHSGLDIAAPTGTPVLASNSGIVTLAHPLNVTGNTVIIDHGLNLFTSYSHLNHIEVQEGDQVVKGSRIGTVGSTGFSTGPHLHWSVTIGSTFVNPWLFLEDEPLSHLTENSSELP